MKLTSLLIIIILFVILSCEKNSIEPPEHPDPQPSIDDYAGSYKVYTEKGIHLPDAWVSLVHSFYGNYFYYDFHPNENGEIQVVDQYSTFHVFPDSIIKDFDIYPSGTAENPIERRNLPLYRGTEYPLVTVKVKYP